MSNKCTFFVSSSLSLNKDRKIVNINLVSLLNKDFFIIFVFKFYLIIFLMSKYFKVKSY